MRNDPPVLALEDAQRVPKIPTLVIVELRHERDIEQHLFGREPRQRVDGRPLVPKRAAWTCPAEKPCRWMEIRSTRTPKTNLTACPASDGGAGIEVLPK